MTRLRFNYLLLSQWLCLSTDIYWKTQAAQAASLIHTRTHASHTHIRLKYINELSNSTAKRSEYFFQVLCKLPSSISASCNIHLSWASTLTSWFSSRLFPLPPSFGVSTSSTRSKHASLVKVHWLLHVARLYNRNSEFCPHGAFVSFILFLQQPTTLSMFPYIAFTRNCSPCEV